MKFYKLDRRNNKWVETACVNEYVYDIDKLAFKLGYIRIYSQTTHRFTTNFYYIADCAKAKSRSLCEWYTSRGINTECVFFSCNQKTFDSYSNAELTRIYDLARCEDCNEIFQTHDIVRVGRKHVFCRDCVTNHAKKCYDCGEWYMKSSSVTEYNLINVTGPVYVCNRCKTRFESRLAHCADCNGLTLNYRHIRGLAYCYNCAGSHDVPNLIAGYHDGIMQIVKQFATTETASDDLLCVGPEIETECDDEPRFVAYDVNEVLNKDKQLAKFEHDGSLRNGVEIILQPCTPNWHYENTEKMQAVFKVLQDSKCDYKSGGYDTCGLHIHINRSFFKDFDYENRFCYLFQRLKEKIRIFSQRTTFNYCRFATGETSWQNIYNQKIGQMQGHGSAVNCSNRDTIEIRIFRGTTDYNTFMAYIEFTRNFATYVRDVTDINKIEHTTFNDIINYCNNKYLNNYCRQLDLLGGAC